MSLSLLLDSADPEVWMKWLPTGIFNGITTNPTLLKQVGEPSSLQNLRRLAKLANNIGCKELHLQAWGSSVQDFADYGFEIGKLSTPQMKVHVKIPITQVGSEAAKLLISSNISVTLTGCYEAKQVLIAAALGATYIAPYLGRINDTGKDGLTELVTMQKVLDRTSSKCKVLTASIREIKEINYLACNGISVFTINSKLVENLFDSKLTEQASKTFFKDAKMQ